MQLAKLEANDKWWQQQSWKKGKMPNGTKSLEKEEWGAILNLAFALPYLSFNVLHQVKHAVGFQEILRFAGKK